MFPPLYVRLLKSSVFLFQQAAKLQDLFFLTTFGFPIVLETLAAQYFFPVPMSSRCSWVIRICTFGFHQRLNIGFSYLFIDSSWSVSFVTPSLDISSWIPCEHPIATWPQWQQCLGGDSRQSWELEQSSHKPFCGLGFVPHLIHHKRMLLTITKWIDCVDLKEQKNKQTNKKTPKHTDTQNQSAPKVFSNKGLKE